MFEKALQDKFKRIFDFQKVTYNKPGESDEQECLFIDIQSSKNNVRNKRMVGLAKGTCTVYATTDRLPFTYFSKCIDKADNADTKDLFFNNFESNTKEFQNVVQRSFDFVYLFDMQYDPDLDTIQSLIVEEH